MIPKEFYNEKTREVAEKLLPMTIAVKKDPIAWKTTGPINFGNAQYYGYLKDGKRSGIGKQLYPNWDLYEG